MTQAFSNDSFESNYCSPLTDGEQKKQSWAGKKNAAAENNIINIRADKNRGMLSEFGSGGESPNGKDGLLQIFLCEKRKNVKYFYL